MPDIVVAPTPKQRALALLKVSSPLIAVFCFGFLALQYTNHVAPLPVCEQLPWLRIVFVAAVLLLSSLAYAYFQVGLQTWRSGQSLPPGTSVLFKRKVQIGWSAKANSLAAFFVAAGLVLALAKVVQFFLFSGIGMLIVGLNRCGP